MANGITTLTSATFDETVSGSTAFSYDYNRDGQVNATDDLIARHNLDAALWPLAAPSAAAADSQAIPMPESANEGDDGSGVPIEEEAPTHGRSNRGRGNR